MREHNASTAAALLKIARGTRPAQSARMELLKPHDPDVVLSVDNAL